MKEHQKGTSQGQIVTKLMQNGVDIAQIRRVRKMYDRMQNGGAMGAATTQQQTDHRTRRNNGQTRNGTRTYKEVEDETRQYYNDEETQANDYTNMRVRRFDNEDDDQYDAYNGDFVEMQDEMDDWMPVDTAKMYEQLVKRIKPLSI